MEFIDKESTKKKYLPHLLNLVNKGDHKLLESLKTDIQSKQFDTLPNIELNKQELKSIFPQLSKALANDESIQYMGIQITEKMETENGEPNKSQNISKNQNVANDNLNQSSPNYSIYEQEKVTLTNKNNKAKFSYTLNIKQFSINIINSKYEMKDISISKKGKNTDTEEENSFSQSSVSQDDSNIINKEEIVIELKNLHDINSDRKLNNAKNSNVRLIKKENLNPRQSNKNVSAGQSLEEKIDILWEMYDMNNDGTIEFKEMDALLSNFNMSSDLYFDKSTINEIAKIVFVKLDPEGTGLITKDNFRAHIKSLTGKDMPSSMNLLEKRRAPKEAIKVKAAKYKAYCLLKFKSIIWLTIYILTNCFWSGYFFYISYKPEFIALAFAKFFAGLIVWNMPLIILFACEKFFSLFSRTFIYTLLPLDDIKSYHRLCAMVFFTASFGHTIAHLCGTYLKITSEDYTIINEFLLTKLEATPTYSFLLFQTYFGITGLMLVIILIIMFITTLRSIITKNFELFWYCHKLYYTIYILTFFHGLHRLVADPLYWKFVIGPIAIFIVEAVIDVTRFFIFKTDIISVKLIENEVIELILKKPKLFINSPGQYARVNIPDISIFQYHPFTIASAPHHKNLVFYISPTGNWTKKLTKIARQFGVNNPEPKLNVIENKKNETAVKLAEEKRRRATNFLFYEENPVDNFMLKPYVRLDGPIGAPCVRYENYKHLIFISGGIGATPFASILFSMLNQIKNGKDLPYLNIQFIWTVRKFSSATWLINLIKRILSDDVNKIFSISLYMTSTEQKSDLRCFFLWHGLDLLKQEKKEMVSGYCENIYLGRPNWADILNKKKMSMLEDKLNDDVGVFVCANYSICQDVYMSCMQQSGKGINFIFNKENF